MVLLGNGSYMGKFNLDINIIDLVENIMKKEKTDKIIWYAIGLNMLILVAIVLYSFNYIQDSSIYNLFQVMWMLSFGWICGRLSKS